MSLWRGWWILFEVRLVVSCLADAAVAAAKESMSIQDAFRRRYCLKQGRHQKVDPIQAGRVTINV